MADESPTVSALSMDRGLPLGNSTDTFSRRALHVKIGNLASEAVPVYLTTSTPGVLHEDIAEDQTTPGIEQTLLSVTVPVGTTRYLDAVYVNLGQDSLWRLEIDGDLAASGRTGPACKESRFNWPQAKELVAGQIYELKLTQRSNSPANEDVEAYIFSSDVT